MVVPRRDNLDVLLDEGLPEAGVVDGGGDAFEPGACARVLRVAVFGEGNLGWLAGAEEGEGRSLRG